jgi:FkbM family methyltransferase
MKRLLFSLYRILVRTISGRGMRWGRIPGLWRLHRALMHSLHPHGIIDIRVHDLTLSINADDAGVAPSLLAFGTHERYETALFLDAIQPGAVVVDVGANTGYYALLASQRTGGNGAVYAFEPVPDNFALLRRNVERNHSACVTCLPHAVLDRRGSARIFTDRDNHGMASLSPHNVNHQATVVDVESITLDEYLLDERKVRSVDVIKIDAEGAEALVLSGARRILRNHNPRIFLEVCAYAQKNIGTDPAAMFEELEQMGYGFRLIDEHERQLRNIEIPAILAKCEKTGTADLLVEREKENAL